ncbi:MULTISPECIES: DUF262 domain-containing protein [unclassified Flavobacterium]|uniref:DUF262 domain-containing protein n=1 Tax=unclassified Flavobacterium TaxID=196869 RepID=UPI0006ABD126|nr:MULTISPECIES: DUF262 domain-containing protein [unclassified Flavobacterium]KOP38922.1 hypothetical protein AKO67_07860 [Flavobacterium sp. VMW]OWU92875.1 hypothetical protein APR43_02120 [Flavobacterium sp. NLM]
MQTGKSTVKTIFDGTRIFNVPIYQRSYSWNKENLQEFLTDLVNQYKDRKYFLGSFLFHINGTRDEFTVIDIVDGQQRLTTFIIFIQALLKKLVEKNSLLVSQRTQRIFIKDEDVYKLELSNEDTSFLHNYILSDYALDKIKTNTPSQSLLLESKIFFTEELNNLEIEILEKIYQTSTEADVLLYVVEEINSATQIFELLNDRGKQLTDLEAIKSFLMYNIGLVSKNPNQLIKNIQSSFGEIYRLIEQNELNEKDILRYHTIAFEGSDEDAKKYIKTKVQYLMKTEPSEMVIKTITDYAIKLKESFEIFVEIQQLKPVNFELSKLFMIGRIAPFYPILMRVRKDDKHLFDDLLKNINSFTFRASLIGLRSNAESQINNSLRNNTLSDIVNLTKTITVDNWWNINERAKETLTSKYIYQSLGNNILKFILFSYENSLRQKKGFPLLGYNEYFTENEREKLNIEHITAQKAKGLQFDIDFEENYLHNIGNLVIDCKASNSSKGSRNTEDKMNAYQAAPIMSQNELDNINCNWQDLVSVKLYINNREAILKNFIKEQFGLA